MKSKKELNLLVTLILIGVLPLLACGVMLCVISMNKLSENLETGVYNQLKTAAEGLDRYYAREYNEHVPAGAWPHNRRCAYPRWE